MPKLLDRFREQGPSRPRSKTETEKRRRVLIVLLIVLAILAASVTLGYGYYETSYKPWRQPIVKVNGTVISMRTFVKMLRLYGVSDASSAPYLATMLEDNELKRQYLKSEFDIDADDVCTDEAANAKIREMLGLSDNSTEEELEEAYDAWLYDTLQLKDRGSSKKDFERLYLKPLLVDEELRKQIGDRDYSATDGYEHAQVQALLIEGSDNATIMRTRWENGEAFETLSADAVVSNALRDLTSDNTANWIAKGIKSDAFDSYVFSAAVGVLSDPIQDSDDTAKYWLIKVTNKESRPLSDTDRETLISEAYDQWLSEAKDSEENDIVYYLDEKGGAAKLAWAIDHATVSED